MNIREMINDLHAFKRKTEQAILKEAVREFTHPDFGVVTTLDPEAYREFEVRGTIRRFKSDREWLASLEGEDYERQLKDYLAGRTDAADVLEVVNRDRRFGGVHDRSALVTTMGKPFFDLGLLTNKGGSFFWRAIRGDTSGTSTLTYFKGNGLTTPDSAGYTVGTVTNGSTFMDVGTDASAVSDRTRNTLRSRITAGVATRHKMDSGYWIIVDADAANGNNNRVARFRATFVSGEADGGSPVNWNEFAICNNEAELASWASHANTMLDYFQSTQGSKVTGQSWETTIEFTLA